MCRSLVGCSKVSISNCLSPGRYGKVYLLFHFLRGREESMARHMGVLLVQNCLPCTLTAKATQVKAGSTPKSLCTLLGQHETTANIKARESCLRRENTWGRTKSGSKAIFVVSFPDPPSPCCLGSTAEIALPKEGHVLLRISISHLMSFVPTQSSVCVGFPDLCFCRQGRKGTRNSLCQGWGMCKFCQDKPCFNGY